MRGRTLVMLVVLFGFAGVASAGLVSESLFAPGDNLLTLDTQTGIEWLNVALTNGQSYNDVEAGIYTAQLGFSYASGSDLSQLFVDSGVPEGCVVYGCNWGYWDFGNPNYVATYNLVNLLGMTWDVSDPNNLLYGATWGQTFGLTADSDANGDYDVGGVRYNGNADYAAFAHWSYGIDPYPALTMGPSDTNQYVGSFLIRETNSTPEPSTMLLMLAGLAGLVGLRKAPVAVCVRIIGRR